MATQATNENWQGDAAREGWRLLQAKFPGKCSACGCRFQAGEWVLWNANTRQTRHSGAQACGVTGQQQQARTNAARYTANLNRQYAQAGRQQAAQRGQELGWQRTARELAVQQRDTSPLYRSNAPVSIFK